MHLHHCMKPFICAKDVPAVFLMFGEFEECTTSMKVGFIHTRYRVTRISVGTSIMVIGLVLYMEDLELEEDYDAMIVKQRKSCGRRGSKESVLSVPM